MSFRKTLQETEQVYAAFEVIECKHLLHPASGLFNDAAFEAEPVLGILKELPYGIERREVEEPRTEDILIEMDADLIAVISTPPEDMRASCQLWGRYGPIISTSVPSIPSNELPICMLPAAILMNTSSYST